jgi:CubicO group peptidase (beta-lactamase class C family)
MRTSGKIKMNSTRFRYSVVACMIVLVVLVARGARAEDTPAATAARIEGPQSPNRQGFDPLTLPELMKKSGVPGVSIAVIKDDSIHWAKGYGLADVAAGVPVDTATVFQAASISKPVTAMAVLRAAQEGRLSLEADIKTILKSCKLPPNQFAEHSAVTPRALLSHTSGTGDGFGFPGYPPSSPRPTPEQIVAGEKPSNTGPVLFERVPFAGFKYSGGGYVILQIALTDTLGKPFPEIMRETILGPLEMTSSTYEQPLPANREAKAAHGHDGRGKPMNVNWNIYPELAAAGLWTTPSDLARFVIEVQKAVRGPAGLVLSQSTAKEMVTPVGVGPFAIGLTVDKRGEGWYFSHSGSNAGFQCLLVGHLRKGYGVVIMTNSDSGGRLIKELEDRVAAAYGWDSLDKPIPR